MAVTAAALFLVLLATPAAYAVQYTVGDSNGWTESEDYESWVQGKTFRVGDKLVFNYGDTHSVDEVTESDYNSCSSGKALKSYNGGSTVITLSKPGLMYFICPTPGHCSSGMKLSINVEAVSSGGSTSPTTPSPRSGSTTTPSGTPSSPSGAPAVMNNGLMILGFTLVFGAVVAIMS